MTDPKPMDPERLAELRLRITARNRCLNVVQDYVAELLADRDYQEAESTRLESLRAQARFETSRAADAWRSSLHDSFVKTARTLGFLVDTDTTPDHIMGLAFEIEQAVKDLKLRLDDALVYRVSTSKLTVERDALLVDLDDSRGETFAAKMEAKRLEALRAKLGELVPMDAERLAYLHEVAASDDPQDFDVVRIIREDLPKLLDILTEMAAMEPTADPEQLADDEGDR